MTTTHWQFIAESLRAELGDYGDLLRLFEQQQQSLFQRDAESVLRLAGEIEAQAHTLAESRERREQVVAAFAEANDSRGKSLRGLLAFVEVDARPLLEALINEVNTLLHRVRRASRHNHVLLARAVELHQETLQALRPAVFSKTYSPAGRVSIAASQATATLHAAG